MDLSKIVSYETTFPLKLRHPKTSEEIGVTFHIRSESSDIVKRLVRQQLDDNAARAAQGEKLRASDFEKQEIARAAAFVASWDWGTNLYKGKAPEFTPAIVESVLTEQDWIFAQTVAAAKRIGNFTKE
ncbi:MAG: hypothetical protein WC026_16105 [Hyphomicrobium sp.]|uniref:hypothetical protein n=1 Tax=Hyphomicrobium sp. TaxID=82 RepID=UPI003568DF8B